VAWQRNATWQHPAGSSSNGSFFDLTAEYLNDENQTISVLTDPRFRAYCASGVTDYVWDAAGTVAYVNNTCVPYYTEGELIEQGYQNIWLYTYFRQESFSRNCTDSAVRPKYYEFDPPDFPYAPDSVKFFGARRRVAAGTRLTRARQTSTTPAMCPTALLRSAW